MSVTSEIGQILSAGKAVQCKARILLKDKQTDWFAARVHSFIYEEEDTKVILLRCEDTIAFPNDTEDYRTSTISLYIKDIENVELYK